MDTSIMSSAPEDPIGARLDEEMEYLQSQISSLKSRLNLQTSTIISSHATLQTLLRLQKSQSAPTNSLQPQTNSPTSPPTDTNPLLQVATSQRLHNQQNVYRACGSITTFRIKDPDPNAVDKGNVLGIRFDVSTTGKFLTPYYVMLNKPIEGSELLRVHRHTLPPYIPLASLAARYLPHTKGAVPMSHPTSVGQIRQDLKSFVRAVRREIVGYHNRISVVKGLRKEFKLDEKVNKKGKGRERVIEDISAADAEARQLRIEWVDGRIGRAVVDDRGEVLKSVVMGPEGRDRESERAILGGRMEGIGERLSEGIY